MVDQLLLINSYLWKCIIAVAPTAVTQLISTKINWNQHKTNKNQLASNEVKTKFTVFDFLFFVFCFLRSAFCVMNSVLCSVFLVFFMCSMVVLWVLFAFCVLCLYLCSVIFLCVHVMFYSVSCYVSCSESCNVFCTMWCHFSFQWYVSSVFCIQHLVLYRIQSIYAFTFNFNIGQKKMD